MYDIAVCFGEAIAKGTLGAVDKFLHPDEEQQKRNAARVSDKNEQVGKFHKSAKQFDAAVRKIHRRRAAEIKSLSEVNTTANGLIGIGESSEQSKTNAILEKIDVSINNLKED